MMGNTPHAAQDASLGRTTSTGHPGSTATWLDLHFTVCRPEYEQMLRSVGLQRGWCVLDAGCGGGSFLPLMAELVGPGGQIAALDLAPENVAMVDQRIQDSGLPCPVATRVGSILALPYPDNSFDAVWCASVVEYLTDAELAVALAEFRRVVRPGGLVALKDFEAGHAMLAPLNPVMLWHCYEAAQSRSIPTQGRLRSRLLRRWLERSGLTAVWQRTMLAERWAPLNEAERRFYGSWLGGLARGAEENQLPEADQAHWRTQRDPASPECLVNHPEFYACEGHVVAVGQVPGSAR